MAGTHHMSGLPPRCNSGWVRPIRVEGDLAYVTLPSGQEAIIDAADAPLVADRSWFAHTTDGVTYARTGAVVDGKRKKFRMHRVILPVPDGFVVDHINGNGLDNRRANLRQVTATENARNTPKTRAGSATGVRYHKRKGRFEVHVYVGTFMDFDAALEAFKKADTAVRIAKKAPLPG